MVRKLSFKLPSFLMGSFVHDDDDDDDGDDDDGDDDDDDEEEAVTDSIKQLLLRKKCPYSKLFSSAFSRIRRDKPTTDTFHAVCSIAILKF